MPTTRIENYEDSPASRQELASFLESAWPAGKSAGGWLRRLAHWWDENPACSSATHHGWVAHDQGQLVGFGGFIPAIYAWAGSRLPGLMATSFVMKPSHTAAAMVMFRRQRELQKTHPIVHATPLPRIQQTLQRMGGCGETQVTRRVFLMGRLRHLRGGRWWPALDNGSRLITRPSEACSITRPYRRDDRLEKWNSLESLEWWCNSTKREHRMLGCVDREGALSSFLLLTPRRLRCAQAWDVVEAFTAREDSTELHALTGALVRDPGLLPGGRRRFLTAASFPSDSSWAGTPALMTRTEKVSHYFLLPESLRDAPKLTVMAEGDLGL